MKKSRFTEEQTVRILKEVEAGTKVAEICRKHGISEAAYSQWKSKYAARHCALRKRSPRDPHFVERHDAGHDPRAL